MLQRTRYFLASLVTSCHLDLSLSCSGSRLHSRECLHWIERRAWSHLPSGNLDLYCMLAVWEPRRASCCIDCLYRKLEYRKLE